MKNETITRLILVLEIAAIIVFHSLKSNTTPVSEIARDAKGLNPNVHQTSASVEVSTPLVLHLTK